MNEKKHKHLDYIQAIINRMAANSFLIKGWTITLVSAIIALSNKESKQLLAYTSLLPIIIFWLLDSYFLFQERLYRAVYNDVRVKNENDIDFDLNAIKYIGENRTWFKSFISQTLLIFYFTLIVLLVAWIVIIAQYNYCCFN
jgi:hypothetical protein